MRQGLVYRETVRRATLPAAPRSCAGLQVAARLAQGSAQIMVQQHDSESLTGHAPTIPTPGSSLRVCVALFRWSGSRLEAATCARGGIPCSVPKNDEPLDATAERVIRQMAGFDAQYMEQLDTFSRPNGADREIVISYLGLFSPDVFRNARGEALRWAPAGSTVIPDDVEQMVLEYALVRLRAKLGYTNIAFHLVPSTFTLSELQQVYESILGQPMDKRNFRRRMIASGILANTNQTRREGSHRPAMLYRFAEQDDQTSYLTPPWQAES
jgi:8-oxo-dGTP diphosphatase